MMTRQLNKITINEALAIFGFELGCKITKEIIKRKFRKLSLLNHPDKGGNAKIFAKIAEAKQVLLRDFDSIITESEKAIAKSVGPIFVDWIKTADLKNIKNPFTVYQQGQKIK